MELHRVNEDSSLIQLGDINIARFLKPETSINPKRVSFPGESGAKLRAQILTLLVELFIDSESVSLPELMCKLEKKILMKVLTQYNGNIKKSSKLLGIKYTTLHEKLKRHNISFRKQPITS
jgi:transcriptional regulator of acetoin/glycerol metabolism